MIKSSNLRRIKQLNFFQAIQHILLFLQSSDLVSLKLEALYNELQSKFNAFDDAIIQARKTGLTEILYELDLARDNVYRALLNYLKGCTDHPVENKAAAAKSILAVFDKYPNIPALPPRNESAAIINLLQDLTPYMSQLAFIGAREFVVELEQKNTEYEACYMNRTDMASQVEVEIAKETRLAVEKAFRNVANAINGLELVLGEEPYKTLSDQINKEVEQAKR